MTSVYADGARKARTEYLKLVSVGIVVPTDEQIAKAKVLNEKFKPRGQFKVVWEPMSYRIEGGKYGNTTTDYLDFTFPLDPEEVEIVRQFKWRGAGNINKRLSIPTTVGETKDKWTRFMVTAGKAGMDMTILDDGDITSKDVGVVFEVESGNVALPTRVQDARTGKWRDSDPNKGEKVYSPFMHLPVKKAPDYVQPDDVPVRVISTDDSEPAEAATVTTGGGTSGVQPEQLAIAFAEAGLIGSRAENIASAAQQINVTNKFGGRAPVFFAKEVQDAAAAGGLVDYAIAKGAIAVVDGVIEKVA